MIALRFEWNSEKANQNLEKHGISFEEAVSVFYDEWAVEFYVTSIQNGRIDS